MKLTLFRLKKFPYELYAFTVNKDYADTFKRQRNQTLFLINTIDINDVESSVFFYKYQNKMLTNDYLNDGKQDFEIICTVEESDKLSESCEYLQNTAQSIQERYKQHNPLKKKFLNLISELTEVIKQRDQKDPTLSVDTFKLFYYLFQNTFIESVLEEDDTF